MSQAIARGVSVLAYRAYVHASADAGIDLSARDDEWISQAIGEAAASAGYHHKDGELSGHPYTAAIDLSVRGLSNSRITTWLEALCSWGFVAFFRHLRSFADNRHIHANFCGVPMKPQLDSQNEEFFRARDGLAGHRRIDDEFWYPEIEARRIPERMYRLSNPNKGPARVVSREDVVRPDAKADSIALYLGDEKKERMWMPLFDGVAYAPVRAWGAILGFEVDFHPATHSVSFDKQEDAPIPVRLVAGVGHAPIRALARQAGLLTTFNMAQRRVEVRRAA